MDYTSQPQSPATDTGSNNSGTSTLQPGLASTSASTEHLRSAGAAQVIDGAETAVDEKRNIAAASPIPDGGLQAWLQVLGSWVIMLETWGLVSTFGVYQTYYETIMLPNESSSSISWIGSVQGSLLFFVGVLAGPLFDAGWFREILLAGLVLVILGQFMTSLCTLYWQVMLAQGICIGIGMGLIFLPSMAIMPQYFHRRRALAIGIASSGSPIGGIVFPILFSHLHVNVGFGWATRAIAFILLGLAVIPLIVMKTRTTPHGKAGLVVFDEGTWTDMPFLLFIVGSILVFLVLYVPFFYIELFSVDHDVWSLDQSQYLVTLLNVGSFFGRIIPGAFADKVGTINTLLACTLCSAVLAFGWLGMHNIGSLIVFTILYGAFSGGVVGLVPAGVVGLSPDLSKVGARMGATFTLAGVSLLVGPPVAGYILGDATSAEWLGMIGYVAGSLILAAFFYSFTRGLMVEKR
ncbi:aspyridones efflux protein apdF [Colletotrichum liriopes]|uniref:Aspyridones efflux protein apdF n=1 Tax=Colletotrichum liriopes TaxID=708192 RepID=A0AA37GT76_9PEZI|nr:aspyridones efflux protein apdF [Colletotrichum liriopes]